MRSSVMSHSIGGFSVCNVLHHVCSMVLMYHQSCMIQRS